MVAARLRELGALLIDADALARDVVEPGTAGLTAIVEAFGPGMLDSAGRLERAGLGAVVFNNPERLAVLNGIVHPLVRERAAAVIAAAPAGAIVVQDIPLLVETGQGSGFHLVLVVDAPDDIRAQRMLDHRKMSADEARSRMAAQASRENRLAAADAVLENTGTLAELHESVDRLWRQRFEPFSVNLREGAVAPRAGGPVLTSADPDWPRQAALLAARLKAAAPDAVLAVDHIGSTSVPGLDARDVIDLQLTVVDLETADRIAPELAAAGFPKWPGNWADDPKPPHPHPELWQKRLHGNADPGRPVNLHVRAADSPGRRFALCFRDWLRDDPAALGEYLAEKRRVSARHAENSTTAGYAASKERWFTAVAGPAMEAWAQRTAWVPPSYFP